MGLRASIGSLRSFRSLRSVASLAACCTWCSLSATSSAQVLVASDFENSADGWSVVTTKGRVVAPGQVQNGVGAATGVLVQPDLDRGVSYWVAPAVFRGNKGAAVGGVLSFDLRQSATGNPIKNMPDVMIRGVNGVTLVATITRFPNTRWTRYHLVLDQGGGLRVGSLKGPGATRAQIMEVLSDVAELWVRAEYRGGGNTDSFDNVTLSAHATGVARSDFETGMDGWYVLGDVFAPDRPATGGNGGGFLRAGDIGDGKYWSFQAPAKFLGDRRNVYGQLFSFDLQSTRSEGKPTGRPDVTLSGGGMTLVYDAPSNPGAVWTNFSVNLHETAGWRIGTVKGARPSAAQFLAVLGCITEIQIRGEFSTKLDVGGLDNVLLGVNTFEQNENCLPDFDLNGILSPDDLGDFITQYFEDPPNPRCDYNRDGLITIDDIDSYFTAYFSGCDFGPMG
ncbi:MAG: laminin B domain-containing protein [Phycisphaerales bacterium]